MDEPNAPTIYCCGFAFDARLERVALIRKAKPAWQAGRLNGIGGKLEEGEVAAEAMEREFLEEAGLRVEWDRWEQFAVLRAGYPDLPHTRTVRPWVVHFFRASGVELDAVKTMTDEEVVRLWLAGPLDSILAAEAVPNLRWLVPMARSLDHQVHLPVEAYYPGDGTDLT